MNGPPESPRLPSGLWPIVVLVISVAILTVPGSYHPITGGLDPSWMWGINAFAANRFRWGRDLIFSYGPLGYLARPLDVGSNLLTATIAYLIVHATIFSIATLTFLRKRQVVPIVLFLAAYPFIVTFDLEFDYQLLAAGGLAAAAAIELGSAPLLAVGAILLSPLVFIKFGTGLAAMAMLVVAEGLWRYRRSSVGPVIWSSILFLLCVAGMGWLLFGSGSGLVDFVRLSGSLARGYNASMAVVGPPAPLIAAGLLLAVTIAIGWLAARRRLSIATPFIVFAIPVAFSAKHAFLRADWVHMPFFFGFLAFAGSYALMLSESPQGSVLCVALLAADAGMFAFVAEPPVRAARLDAITDIATGQYARYRLGALLDFSAIRNRAHEASNAYLSLGDRLPPSWPDIIGRNSVLVMPWELSLCPATNLACVPYPTLQMYATLTPELDRWTANRLRRQPPQFAIIDPNAIDGRNTVWDCPETWLSLIEGWEVVQHAPEQQRLLLRRRATARTWRQEFIGRSTGRVGHWIDVPETTGPARLAIELRATVLGWFQRYLFRADPVLLHVTTQSGRTRAYRIVVDNARLGLMIHAMPKVSEDLAQLFDCCVASDPVRRFRITGPGARAFHSTFDFTWSRVEADRWTQTEAPTAPVTPTLVAGAPLMAIDAINGQLAAGHSEPLRIRAADGVIQVEGWAVDQDARMPAQDVILRWDDGRHETRADYGIDRLDVASVFTNAQYRHSGFRGVTSSDDLGIGRHRLSVLVTSSDGRTVKVGSTTVDIDLR